MSIKNFRDLLVWQKSMDLVTEIYQITAQFPKEELFGLSNQLKRAAVSIPSNIAEGHQRGTKEFLHFLKIAKGSVAEVETQLEIACNLKMIDKEQIRSTFLQITELHKMISGLMKKLIPNP